MGWLRILLLSGRTFYDAAKRNQVGYALRIAYPFIQAFVNAIKWWSKAMIRNPQRPFRSGVVTALVSWG